MTQPVNERWRAAVSALRARYAARLARRDEGRALAALGELVAGAAAGEGARPGCELVELEASDALVRALEGEIARSLAEDRADYAQASSWIRPVVIARGLAARAVVRDRLRRARRLRSAACARAGEAMLDDAPSVNGAAGALAEDVRAARARAAAATLDAERLLAPFGGAVVPAPVCHVGREVTALGGSLAKELRGHLLPRVPALVGLAVGWWVASTFTDSHLSAMLHGLGIGSGPRRAVSAETYRMMSFWLPVVAAALCSYAGARLRNLVRSRYAPAASASHAGER